EWTFMTQTMTPDQVDAQVTWRQGNFTGNPNSAFGRRYTSAPSSNDPSKVGSAAWARGQLHRAEWEDYLSRFRPRDDQLREIVMGTQDNEQAIDRARLSVDTSFASAQGSLDRNRQRLGLSDMPDVSAQRDHSMGLARTAAEVDAVNRTRMHTKDRDMKLMSGNLATGLNENRAGGM